MSDAFKLLEMRLVEENDLVPTIVLKLRAQLYGKEVEERVDLGKLEAVKALLNDRQKLALMVTAKLQEHVEPEKRVELAVAIGNRAQELLDAFKKAYERYIYVKTGLRFKEIDSELPPKRKVFIERMVHAVYSGCIIIVKPGHKAQMVVAGTPKEYVELKRSYQYGSLVMLTEKGVEILDPLVNADGDVEIYEIEYPYAMFYLSNERVVISKQPLPRGEVELRLRVPSEKELKEMFEALTPLEKLRLAMRLMRAFNIPRAALPLSSEKRDDNASDGVADAVLSMLMDRMLIAEKGLPKHWVDHHIRSWSRMREQLFAQLDGDPLVIEFYKAMMLPYFKPEYAPHTLLITATKAGKTYLYEKLVGKDPLCDVTPKTLVGHYSPEERRVEKGILHGETKAVQVESLESERAKDTLSLVVTYMRGGKATRAVLRKITVEGTAPIILTGNIIRYGKKAYTLQNWLKLGLLSNPEALSSRLLLFYKDTRKLRVKDKREFERLAGLCVEIIDSDAVYAKLRAFWNLPQVEAWLNKEDKLNVEVRFGEKAAELSDLATYLEGLRENFAPLLRALALNNALVDFLDRVYFTNFAKEEEVEALVREALERAEEVYEYFKAELSRSIEEVVRDFAGDLDPTAKALDLPLALRKLLVAVHDYINEKAVNEDPAKLPLEDVLNFAVERGLFTANAARILRSRLKNGDPRYADLLRELRRLGVAIVFSSEGDYVVVDMLRFKSIDFQRLVESLN